MKKYIDREAVYKSACAGCTRHGEEIGSCFSYEPCEKLIFAFTTAPAADVVERKRGEWVDISRLIRDPDGDWVATQYKCPFCGRTEWKKEPFCNCGADMRGEKHE